jgi:hypothetical protein
LQISSAEIIVGTYYGPGARLSSLEDVTPCPL